MEDWEKSEKKSCQLYGRKTPASGSKDSKLDIIGEGIYDGFRIENKFTQKKSRSVTLEELKKAFIQSIGHLCDWFFVLDFNLENRYVLMDESLFIRMQEEIAEHRNCQAVYENFPGDPTTGNLNS